MLVSENPIEERLVFEVASSVAPPCIQQAAGPTPAPSFFTMEEVSSVKDSLTFGLPIQRLIGEVGGSSGQPMVPNIEPTKVYVVVQDANEENVALGTTKKEEKGKV